MKKIYLFTNGKAFVEETSIHTVDIDGEDPLQKLDATQDNINIHFPNVHIPKDNGKPEVKSSPKVKKQPPNKPTS